MTNVSEKSVLAKLLATENIHVEHRKVSTAHFDLASRTLCLPIWKDMSSDLYDLLIGHEVGHALETPTDAWENAINAVSGKGFKTFLNVIEDARIEIVMKNKYPGLRRSFYNGYRELFERNFFNTDGLDLASLRFIDRINLYAKVGPFLNIPFTAEEQIILDRVMTNKTFEGVVELANQLYDGAKSEDISDLLDQLDMMDDGEDQDAGQDFESDDSDQPEPNTDDGETSADVEGDSDEDQDEKEIAAASDFDNSDEVTDEDPVSLTDQALTENEERLIDERARENFYCILPKIDPSNFVVSNKAVSQMMSFVSFDPNISVETLMSDIYAEFIKNNQKFVNAMVQQFERKKTANQLRKAKVSKTGKLNMDKIWAHKIAEDLFLQSTNVPNGKNHGMILHLDMSGSMSHNMQHTVEQLVILAMFCKKTNIPFEVYGFINSGLVPDEFVSSVDARNNHSNPQNLVINHSGFRMLQLIAANTSGARFKQQIKNLLTFGGAVSRRRNSRVGLSQDARQYFILGSTPLEESLIVARHIADDFRRVHRVEILNTVYLTDGDGDCNLYLASNHYAAAHRMNVVIKDEITGKSGIGPYNSQYKASWRPTHYFDALHDIYQKATGSKITNFYLADSYTARGVIRNLERHGVNISNIRKEFNKNGSVFIQRPSNVIGFKNQFLINTGNMKARDDAFEVQSNTRKDLMREFKKFQTSKQNNRAILSKVIDCFA